jgi:choline dehydrogenase-like flavoprotein
VAEFDYLVVGGGTVGCIVAARLAEDPAVSVGLVEWGPRLLQLSGLVSPRSG